LKLAFSFLYLFLYPVGHFGLTAVTFLVILPLTQLIELFFTAAGFAGALATGIGVADGVGAGDSCESFTLIVGDE
jgi:hypothetical protein